MIHIDHAAAVIHFAFVKSKIATLVGDAFESRSRCPYDYVDQLPRREKKRRNERKRLRWLMTD